MVSIFKTARPAAPLDPEETALVERARVDPDAFAALYRRCLPPVYHYLLSRTACRADAEDLTAQVFLAALEKLPGYRHQAPFTAWLIGIARHKTADFYRRRPEQPLDSAAGLPGPWVDPLSHAAQAADLRRLGAAVHTLPAGDQELLRLRFAAGLGFAEIAGLLGRTESAVKMSLYRLLERLKVQLEESHD